MVGYSRMMHEEKITACKVLLSTGGVQGYSLAHMEDPDIIVMDYKRPQGSGDHLLSRLKSNLATRETPAIVITGKKFDGGKDYACERDVLGRRGAVAHLTKWLNLEALVEVVKRYSAFATA